MIEATGREHLGQIGAQSNPQAFRCDPGAGAISDWNLKLTSAVPTFDWLTLSDVVMHVRYTAREGGELLRTAAIDSLTDALAGIPLRRGFSAQHEFPSEWSAFLHPDGVSKAVLKIDIAENRFPCIARDAGLSIRALELVALVKDTDENLRVLPPSILTVRFKKLVEKL